jgi:uncharacterized membrane protein
VAEQSGSNEKLEVDHDSGNRGAAPGGRRSTTDRLYFLAVAVKGVDGVLELLLGLVLSFVPSLAHTALEAAAARGRTGSAPLGQFISNYLEGLDGTLTHWGIGLVIAYLIAHGAIKVLLVICLLLRLSKVYPAAIGVLIAFLALEIYLFIASPGVTLGLFIALDALIIYLVVREYRQLKTHASEPNSRRTERRKTTL